MMEKTQPGVDPNLRNRTNFNASGGFIDDSGLELANGDYRNEVYFGLNSILQIEHTVNPDLWELLMLIQGKTKSSRTK